MEMDMPFPLKNPNACEESGVSCPIQATSNYEYEATLPVLKVYPRVKVEVKWQLVDENGKDIVCVLIPAQIKWLITTKIMSTFLNSV